MPRLTREEEEALAAQMEADADDADAWGKAVRSDPRTEYAGAEITVDYPGETAHRIYERAAQRDVSILDLIRLYVERGLDADDAAEARSA